MKTKRRTLIILLVLAALAAAALAAINSSNTKAEQAASAAAEGTISLSAFAADDLTQISYTYNGETLTLNYSDGNWTLEGDEAYHLDSSACNTMVTALSALNAKRSLSAEAGEDYGFSEPLVTVEVTAAGQTNTFVFGAENTVTGDIYVRKNDESAVYTVSASKASCFEMSKTDLFGAFNPAQLTSSDIEAVSYTLRDGTTVELEAVSEQVEAESEAESDSAAASEAEYETVWRFKGDGSTEIDETKMDGILSALGSYVSGQITNADPAQYGFDSPLVTVTVTTADGTVSLAYASGTDGYYMRPLLSSDSSIYQVDETTVQALLYTAQELTAAE